MAFTIDLPEELAIRLATVLPEEERSQFAVTAIEEALEARLRDEAECVAAVEEAIAEMEAGRSLSFEEEQARWQSQRAALLAKAGVHAA
jgi:predicted transcriptional regulator